MSYSEPYVLSSGVQTGMQARLEGLRVDERLMATD